MSLQPVNQTQRYPIEFHYCQCHSSSCQFSSTDFLFLHPKWSISASWVFYVSIHWWVFFIFAFLELIYPKKAPLWLLGLAQFLFSMFKKNYSLKVSFIHLDFGGLIYIGAYWYSCLRLWIEFGFHVPKGVKYTLWSDPSLDLRIAVDLVHWVCPLCTKGVVWFKSVYWIIYVLSGWWGNQLMILTLFLILWRFLLMCMG